jgi:protein TonB
MKPSRNWMLRLATIFVLAMAAFAHAESTVPSPEQNIQRMKRDQEALLRKLKPRIQKMEDSPRKEEFKARIEEIEQRLRAPQDLYVAPNSKLTSPMKIFYERMRRRIEDCGTRHFPVRDGQKLHGKAVVAITLSHDGQLLKTEVVNSSGERLIDGHIPKLVAASAPFGDIPANVMLDQRGSYKNLVVVVLFVFTRGDKPLPDDSPEAERCRWE